MDSLHAFPEIAQRLGQFMATFAAVERLLWSLYGLIIRSSDEGARALLSHIDSFTTKLTAFRQFLPYSPLDNDARAAALQILKEAGECNQFRNALAHGLYLSDDHGKRVVLITGAVSEKRNPRETVLTAHYVDAKIAQLIALRDRIRNEFFGIADAGHHPPHIR
jgi:hypothetical protein